MDTKTSTFGLSPSTLAELISIAGEPPEDLKPEDRSRASIMQSMLDTAAPPIAMPPSAGHGYTIGELLLDEQAPLASLTALKDYGKYLSTHSTRKGHDNLGTLIYHMAIAAALVHAGELITSHSRAALAEAFGQLAAQAWMPGDVADLLRKAAAGANQTS